MSADQNNNNLEDFFRNALNNFSAEPSSQLWERIEGAIPAKPKRKIRPVYIVFALLLLLMLSALVYQYLSFQEQMKDMAQKVEHQSDEMQDLKRNFEDQMDRLSNQLSLLPNTSTENTQRSDYTQTATVTQHPSSGAMKTSGIEKYGVDSKQEGLHDFVIPRPSEAKDNPSILSVFQDKPAENHRTVVQETPASNFSKKVELLDYIALKTEFPLAQLDTKLEKISLPKQKRTTTSMEIYTAAYRTFPRVNLSPSGKASNDYEAYLSKSIGALLNFGINFRWDIQLGLGYSNMRINDEVSKELYYSNEESDGSGSTYSSSYSYPVRTNYGDLLISSQLVNQKANDGQDIKDGDPFLLNLKFQKEIRYINLPVFVRYKIGDGRLRYSIKGGVVQKFLYDEKTKLSSVETESDRLMNGVSMIENDLGAIRQSSTDALLGLGLEYQMTQRNKIHVESIFVQSLQEIYKDIQPFSIGIQLGLQHRLGK